MYLNFFSLDCFLTFLFTGPFYLLRDLLEKCKSITWDDSSSAPLDIRFCAIQLLCALSQNNISPDYEIQNIETNVTLYEGDEEYVKEVSLLIDQVVTPFLDILICPTFLFHISAFSVSFSSSVLFESLSLSLSSFFLVNEYLTIILSLSSASRGVDGADGGVEGEELHSQNGRWVSHFVQFVYAPLPTQSHVCVFGRQPVLAGEENG